LVPHDIPAATGYRRAMFRRGWLLILCLLVSSLVASGTVCASENGAASTVSCGATNDAGHVPGDEDKGAPHQHAACHGHSVTATFDGPVLSPVLAVSAAPSASQPERLTRRTIDPALEPPKA
jgi:hypothetical protein